MTGIVDQPRLVQSTAPTRRDDSRRRVAVVGSTGSIGTQTLDVLRSAPDRFVVSALGAARSVDLLAAQAEEFRPDVVAIADSAFEKKLAELLPAGIELRSGPGALPSLVETADVVLNAVVGFAGLGVTVAALRQGRRLALANKESLVAGAPVVRRARSCAGAELVPVDSEHCAIHQCLACGRPEAVARVLLTASGGPFRGRTAAELASVTVGDALAHPTWQMGPKITIAQLSVPDMRLPIGYALGYPDRLAQQYGSLDFAAPVRLEFEPPDFTTFPCVRLAYEAGRAGGSAPAWLNAANEIAVAAFLDGRLRWSAIAEVVAETLEVHEPTDLVRVEDVLAADALARVRAADAVQRRERAT